MTTPNYRANPEVVLQILQERAQTDPYIRELVRGAILEAALMEATQQPEDSEQPEDRETDADTG